MNFIYDCNALNGVDLATAAQSCGLNLYDLLCQLGLAR